ncbi:unnamed protein product [Ambrosiozyma monospora]|uniref:Unnamed protein product n=1 Tax=Ambrosiozyma monospora TaxID=43982 RepID=A0A9W7DH74_AMBMO|nr:unnamed protein product [Ambrosiozyma monospora]
MESEGKDTTKLNMFGFSMGGGIVLNYLSHGKLKDKINAYCAGGPLILLHPDTLPAKPLEWIVRAVCCLPFGKTLKVKTALKMDYITGDPVYHEYLTKKSNTENLSGTFVETRDFILRGRDLLTDASLSTVSKTKPLLIVHGDNDHINDCNASELYIEKLNKIEGMKNKELVKVENGRHCILFDAEPVATTAKTAVLKFFDEFN